MGCSNRLRCFASRTKAFTHRLIITKRLCLMVWGPAAAGGVGDAGNRKVLDMTLAAIMVSVDFDPADKARISLAADLAARFKSVLIGVAGWPLLRHPPEKLLETQLAKTGSVEWAAKELDKLGCKFQAIAKEFTDQVEWRSSMNFPRDVIAAEARAADLVVIGQE